MRLSTLVASVVVMACVAPVNVLAGPGDTRPGPWPGCPAEVAHASPWSVDFSPVAPSDVMPAPLRYLADIQEPPARRPVPFEYSEGYKTRAKIHKIASFATLPLFAANYFVGQDLYNNPGESESKKGVHAGLAATTGVLFGVNTVTGVWNLWEGRKDPNHRTKRMTHGILMLARRRGLRWPRRMLAPDDEDAYSSVPTSERPRARTGRSRSRRWASPRSAT